jgi:tRNA A-37 threonylcarbamoyl transferase component Bud32
MAAATAAEQIGAYVLEKELGRGAHGVVYRAHHRDHRDMPVALKLIENRGNLDRLLLEPAMLSQLRHPCIVGLEDYFLSGDNLVVALELIEGEDLQTLLDRGETFGLDEIRDFLVQMGSALAEAHAKSVIHRDIKPSNVLVVRDGGRLRFVLTDFGIGQRAEGIQVRKHTGGTFFFMAPEQMRGRPCPQSDLWALGVVAYRLLTGRLPFPGPTLAELSKQILYATPPPPSEVCRETIDPQMEASILRLLDKSLQERFASAEELLQALGHRGAPMGVLGPARQTAAAAPSGVTLDRKLDRGISRRRWWIVLCVLAYLLPSGLIAALLVLGGMVLFYKAQRDERWSRRATVLGNLGAFVLLAVSLVLRYFFPMWDLSLSTLPLYGSAINSLIRTLTEILGPSLLAVLGIVAVVLGLVLYIVYLFLPVIAGALYATLRRLERERMLRNAARQEGEGSDRYLQALRDALDTRFEDVGLHLKYAEALFARGRVKEATVEARLLLDQDPYHFNGNLLLANAYHALGLLEDCLAVCDRYLAVSGYCFEFGELREQCQRRLCPA